MVFTNFKIRYLLLFSMFMTLVGQLLNYVGIINDSSTVVTYFFMMFPIVTGMLLLGVNTFNSHKKYRYLSEINIGFFVVVTFLLISVQKIIQTKQFTFSTVGESCRIITPFIYAFLAINFLTEKEINLLMKVGLCFGWIGYFVDNGLSHFTLKDLASISFVNSYSPFENFKVALLAFALCIYFIYRYKEEKICTFFALLLNFFVFKRVQLVSAVLLLLVVKLKKDEKIAKSALYIITVGVIVATFLYYHMLKPENFNWTLEKFHLNVVTFSMSRAYRVWYVINNGFQSYGLGSSTALLATNSFFRGSTFELDLIKILWELGPIAIVVFISSYLYLTRRNLYAVTAMLCCLLQLLMASGLTNYYEWFIILTSIGLTYYKDIPKEVEETDSVCLS